MVRTASVPYPPRHHGRPTQTPSSAVRVGASILIRSHIPIAPGSSSRSMARLTWSSFFRADSIHSRKDSIGCGNGAPRPVRTPWSLNSSFRAGVGRLGRPQTDEPAGQERGCSSTARKDRPRMPKKRGTNDGATRGGLSHNRARW